MQLLHLAAASRWRQPRESLEWLRTRSMISRDPPKKERSCSLERGNESKSKQDRLGEIERQREEYKHKRERNREGEGQRERERASEIDKR